MDVARSPSGRWLLLDVEVFHAGSFRQNTPDEATFTDDDLRAMVENFRLNAAGPRPGLVPPVGVGHDTAESEDAFYTRDDALAHGRVVALRAEPVDIDGDEVLALVADLEIDSAAAAWVQAGNLTRVSAEITDEPGEGLEGSGATLRRVALLGAALPELKRLHPLPLPVRAPALTFSARRATVRTRRPANGRVYVFSEFQAERVKKKPATTQRAA